MTSDDKIKLNNLLNFDDTELRNLISEKENKNHYHSITNISNLQTELNGKEEISNKGITNGYAPLDQNKKLPLENIPDSILGQLIHAGSLNATNGIATLTTNAKEKLGTQNNAITLTNNTTNLTGYKANQGNYYLISMAGTFAGISFEVGDWLVANDSGWGKIDNTDAVTSVAGKIGAVSLTKSDVGLENVENTSDANKPISNPTQTALDGKSNTNHNHAIADVSGLQLSLNTKSDISHDHAWNEITGKPTSFTPATHNHDTAYSAVGHTHTIANITSLQSSLDGKAATTHSHSDLATNAFVNDKIANLIDNAPSVLDTLDKLSKALGDDPNFATTAANNIGNKADKTDFNSHTGNTGIHVTSTEKTTWNGKSNLAIGTTETTAAAGNHNHDSAYSASGHTHTAPIWDQVTGKPSSFTPASHTHGNVTNDGKKSTTNTTEYLRADGTWATPPNDNTVYTHPVNHPANVITQDANNRFVTDTEKTSWNGKSNLAIGTTSTTAAAGNHSHTAPTWEQVTNKPTTYAPSSHTHSIDNITNLQTELDNLKSYQIPDISSGNIDLPIGTFLLVSIVNDGSLIAGGALRSFHYCPGSGTFGSSGPNTFSLLGNWAFFGKAATTTGYQVTLVKRVS